MIKEAEELQDSNKKKVNRLQTEINELKESISDNFIDVNSNNKTNSNSKNADNNNSENTVDRKNKYNEKVE